MMDSAESFHAQALQLVSAGRVAEAVQFFERALELKPESPIWQFNSALAWQHLNRLDKAIQSYRNAVVLAPDFFDAWNNLAAACKDVGDLDLAVMAGRRAIALRPNAFGAHLNLGNALKASNDLIGAEAAYHQALKIDASCFSAHLNLAGVLQQKGRAQDAIKHAETAVRLAPKNPDAHNNLGVLLQAQNRTEEAISSYQRALELAPKRADFWTNLGKAQVHRLELLAAGQAYERALQSDPNFVEAHYGRAWLRLLTGNFAQGWTDYEWRLQMKNAISPHSGMRRWRGENLNGHSILVHSEQGLGDTIQFARYIPMIVEHGGKVIFECPRQLKELMKSLPGNSLVVSEGELLPSFDYQIPLVSLPFVFQTTFDSIPRRVPYLHAPRGMQLTLPLSKAATLSIGLIWSGSGSQTPERRPVSFRLLEPLLEIEGATFYSLQVGPRSNDVELAGMSQKVFDLSGQLTDFAATAAVIEQLDLVISIDTSVAHLAGALGKPVWVLLPFSPDWRWLLAREDSPWYPTMRLFRQKKPHDWTAVLQDLFGELRILLTRGSLGRSI
jgi:tetratricopeptide (TPR) repeat protein